MTDDEIKHMRDNVGRLISMNGFFSTSQDRDQAIKFALKPSQRKNVVAVLFEIDGDTHLDRMIFADIAEQSTFPQEQEVLFDLATVFRIVHVEVEQGKNLWLIQLTGKTNNSLDGKTFSSGVEKSTYAANEYITSVGKESEERSSTLLFGRLVSECDDHGFVQQRVRNRMIYNDFKFGS